MEFQKSKNEARTPSSAARPRQGKEFRSLFIALCFVFLCAFAAQAQNNPMPRLVQPLVPTTVIPGQGNLTLTVGGTGFVSTSVVNWNGAPLATTFVSSEKLTATVPAANVATAGTGSITVSSPAPGGGISNTLYFPVARKLAALGFSRIDLPSGANPVAVAVGDFNNDGKTDFAVANDFDNSVGVYIGNGDGTFQTAVTYAVNLFPLNMFVGDFNNDGKLDIVTVNAHNRSVSVLLGNGDGTFQTHLDATVGANPQSLNIGDFNGDGNLDVVTANFGGNTVSVLFGNGAGGLSGRADYSVGANPLDVTVGDFNGDGIPDLAVANNGDSTISILLGNSNGTFQAQTTYATGSTPNGITTADFNGDGKLDLATTDAGHLFSVLLGNGDGTFQTHVDYAAGNYPAYTITAYDMNSDGKLDILFGNFNDDNIAVYLGVGDGTFKTPATTYPSLMQPVSLSVGDFNNDGRLDVVAANEASNMVSVFLQNNQPQPTLTPPSLMFGAQNIGLNGGTMTMTLKNTAATTLTGISISLSGVNASEYSQSNNCPTSLTSGQSCVISVTFLPLTIGVKTAAVTVVSSAGTLLGPLNGSAVQYLTISKDSLTFPLTVIGTSAPSQTVTLTNKSGVLLSIYSVMVTGHNVLDFGQTNTCGTGIPPLGSCTMTITFTPVGDGGRQATIIIMSSSSTPKRGISLFGTATMVSLSATSLKFGKIHVGQSSAPMTVTVTNVGPQTLTVNSISFTGVTDFSETDTCTGNVLQVGGTCTISVVFTPQLTGLRTATLNINTTDIESPSTVALSGTGQ